MGVVIGVYISAHNPLGISAHQNETAASLVVILSTYITIFISYIYFKEHTSTWKCADVKRQKQSLYNTHQFFNQTS